MSSTAQTVSIEALARDVFTGVAVAAYTRGIDLKVHIDQRLPARALGDPEALAVYLHSGLSRTIEAGRTGKITLAFWLVPGEGRAGIEIEACRSLIQEGLPSAKLGDLWALPLGEGRARPRPHRQDRQGETVLVTLPLVPDLEAPLLAESRREAFEGRYLLHVRDVLIDPNRMRDSLAALGIELGVTTSPEVALELARQRAEAGKSVDIVLMDAAPLGAAAIELARSFRADPRLASAVIVLAGTGRSGALPPEEARLFDAVATGSLPWRPLFDAVPELLATRAPAQDGSAGGSARPDIPSLAGRRILIAEDVGTNQVLLKAILEPTGASIDTVSGGESVLTRQTEAPADLILMDLQMPGMGGIAAARRIRALDGMAGKVPIVALTAYAQSGDRERALAAGMDAYLAKPVVVAEFYELMRRLLGSGKAAG